MASSIFLNNDVRTVFRKTRRQLLLNQTTFSCPIGDGLTVAASPNMLTMGFLEKSDGEYRFDSKSISLGSIYFIDLVEHVLKAKDGFNLNQMSPFEAVLHSTNTYRTNISFAPFEGNYLFSIRVQWNPKNDAKYQKKIQDGEAHEIECEHPDGWKHTTIGVTFNREKLDILIENLKMLLTASVNMVFSKTALEEAVEGFQHLFTQDAATATIDFAAFSGGDSKTRELKAVKFLTSYYKNNSKKTEERRFYNLVQEILNNGVIFASLVNVSLNVQSMQQIQNMPTETDRTIFEPTQQF